MMEMTEKKEKRARKDKPEAFTFETGMAELEALVSAMERGELPLQETFEAYERGVKLSVELSKLLAAGNARIAMLKEALAGIEEVDISDEVAE